MSAVRAVRELRRGVATLEGAGVRLRRLFGFEKVPGLDPFLLLDDFSSDEADDYLAGFPWHPHRGIETITYVLRGEIEHGDSLGNAGVIGPGDVQWMTAGSGIVHQEMPREGRLPGLQGFQLWANLPAAEKMMPPRYRGVAARDIPLLTLPGGAKVRIVCGRVGNVEGPVRGIRIDPEYLDVELPAGAAFRRELPAAHAAFAYVFAGSGRFADPASRQATAGTLAVFGDGDAVEAVAGSGGLRFLLVSGRPLREPVAWRGPIVMNTQEELRRAFAEYEAGTFLKHRAVMG
ncbi:MAG TPA: pirin family protein [Candidatus Aminicenantes bacterium]|nr:pirin family protein [Candidatus Aminicenantes bacterium]